jgi:hypothetical protein
MRDLNGDVRLICSASGVFPHWECGFYISATSRILFSFLLEETGMDDFVKVEDPERGAAVGAGMKRTRGGCQTAAGDSAPAPPDDAI